jgi:hypothetical protein
MNSDTASHIDKKRPCLRWPSFLWLALFLLWLPFEDTQTRIPMFLAGYLTLWAALILFDAYKEKRSGIFSALLGFFGGLLTPVLASFLMLFKSGVHAHSFSEYTPNQFIFLLSNIPLAAILGFLIGLSSYRLLAFSKDNRD